MGVGPFNIDRPLTAGDDGWFGGTRPLVGAANAIQADVTTQSAGRVAVANSTPESIHNLREEINEVNRELDNKRAKLERFEEVGEMVIMRDEGIGMRAAERRREDLFDDIRRLENHRDDLVNQLEDKRSMVNEGQLRPSEIEDGIESVVENSLMGIGISKGPFFNVGGETTTITFSKTGIRSSDLGQTRQSLEDLGFQVSEVRAIEI